MVSLVITARKSAVYLSYSRVSSNSFTYFSQTILPQTINLWLQKGVAPGIRLFGALFAPNAQF
jgi:hypothetical protein